MYFAYVIRSEEGHVYTGHTSDPESRLIRHNAGETPFTRRGCGWRYVLLEPFDTRSEAMAREKWLKSGRGRDWLRGQGLR
jgi:putative endonuclease